MEPVKNSAPPSVDVTLYLVAFMRLSYTHFFFFFFFVGVGDPCFG